MKISLFGKHSHRTPLSYDPYRCYFARLGIQYEEDPIKADVLVTGFYKDLDDNQNKLADIKRRNPGLRIVVVSEEPLWDLLWSPNFLNPKVDRRSSRVGFEYYNLNHFTSNIYEFSQLPYFITTEDKYFSRYAYLFKRNLALPFNKLWPMANRYRYAAFIAEHRSASDYEKTLSQRDCISLSNYRTKVAELVSRGFGDVFVQGKGWNEAGARQNSPDWHVEKVSEIDLSTVFISGIENTHFQTYVTEKIFDAFACGGIPLYYSSGSHFVNKVVVPGSFLNLYGVKPDETLALLSAFPNDSEVKEKYFTTQSRLANLFANTANLQFERERVAKAVVSNLTDILNL